MHWFTVLNHLTFNKNVNKYAHDRLLGTFSSQCRYIQCWTGPEQQHPRVLGSTISVCFFSSSVAMHFNRKLWWLLADRRCLVSDQVAPAHHNHNQSYRPSYSDTTWRRRKKKENRRVTTAGNTLLIKCVKWQYWHLVIYYLVHEVQSSDTLFLTKITYRKVVNTIHSHVLARVPDFITFHSL